MARPGFWITPLCQLPCPWAPIVTNPERETVGASHGDKNTTLAASEQKVYLGRKTKWYFPKGKVNLQIQPHRGNYTTILTMEILFK